MGQIYWEAKMAMTTASFEGGVLRPAELAMLSHVYEEITSAPQYLGDKPAREALAKHILTLYQSGVSNPQDLTRLASPKP